MTFARGTVAVVGSINVDLLLMVDRLPKAGETVLGTGGTLSPGGKGANQAVAAARQGAEVLLVGAVGGDANAAEATRLLRDSGVNLGIVVIPGANQHVDPAAIAAALPRLHSCDVVVLQGELPSSTVEFVLRELRDAPVKVVLNLAPVIPLGAESIRAADVLIVNEHEAIEALRLLSGQAPVHPAPSIHPELSFQTAPSTPDVDPLVRSGLSLAASLVSCGVAAAVVTLGARGAVVAESGGSFHVPPVAVEAVDTTGAGDAFVGAVAAGLAEGMTLREAGELAVAVAAQSVASYGAQQSYPWRTGAARA
jgi:ribokinase